MSPASKQEIRDQLLSLRESLPEEERAGMSRLIRDALVKTPAFLKAETVFLYYPIRGEVDCRDLFYECARNNKRVAYPRTEEEGLRFLYVTDPEQLLPGRFSVPEPVVGETADDDEEALLILPGLAFSSEGYRLGYGAGYFDRYLSRHTLHPTIGLCYDFQLIDSLPVCAHDARADLILTECRELIP